MRFRAGDVVGGFFARALETQLEMIEPGLHQGFEFGLVKRKTGSNEADVKACGASAPNKVDDVRASERLAAGEISLEDACFGSFFEDARPGFCRKFVGAGL